MSTQCIPFPFENDTDLIKKDEKSLMKKNQTSRCKYHLQCLSTFDLCDASPSFKRKAANFWLLQTAYQVHTALDEKLLTLQNVFTSQTAYKWHKYWEILRVTMREIKPKIPSENSLSAVISAAASTEGNSK